MTDAETIAALRAENDTLRLCAAFQRPRGARGDRGA